MHKPIGQVLIADDNVALANIVAERFEANGLASIACRDGVAAWNLFQAREISVVVSDFDMPGMSGTELCRRVHGCSPGLPFFLVTAREHELHSDPQIRTLNVERIFPKPFRFAELLCSVKQSLFEQGRRSQSGTVSI